MVKQPLLIFKLVDRMLRRFLNTPNMFAHMSKTLASKLSKLPSLNSHVGSNSKYTKEK